LYIENIQILLIVTFNRLEEHLRRQSQEKFEARSHENFETNHHALSASNNPKVSQLAKSPKKQSVGVCF